MTNERDIFDLAVVGGGINGTGIAADAAGRGLKVVLAEQNDLASATSSASSKLIHGGLRYLETYQFRLVREALAEREVLLAKAPHIVWPMRFVLPVTPGLRSPLLIRAGLFLYDHLAKRRSLPGSSGLSLAKDPMGAALKPDLARGFSYWDCWVDDSRLVLLNARAAADRGAEVSTRTRVTKLRREGHIWRVILRTGGREREIAARALVNAAGPWVMDAALQPEGGKSPPRARARLVKGSHIVVPRIAGCEDAFIFQHGDGRVVFALPFAGRFTLIGTTDIGFRGDPGGVGASEEEIEYLLKLANAYLRAPLGRDDVVWSFAGVRSLLDDGGTNPSAVTRDYHLQLAGRPGEAPMLSVYGGKITTFRRLAEAALEMLGPVFPGMGRQWTAGAPLPGGDMPDGFEAFLADIRRRRPQFRTGTLHALARRHGTLTETVLGDAASEADMGEVLVKGGAGYDLTAREVAYMARHEWAQAPEDVLWRRTKLGLAVTPGDMERIRSRIAAYL
jgi:glycerol-3-phosphate dehydrogenase